jgi:hypothetical protein
VPLPKSTRKPTTAVEPMDHTPTFRVVVTSRTTTAVNYKHRSGAAKVDFSGTNLMPRANGQAKVESIALDVTL